MIAPRFILASASPARRRLLQTVGIDPIVQPSDFDESLVQLSAPADLVQTLSRLKAETVVSQIQPAAVPTLVMGCDSVLAIGGEVHGKPASVEEAIARWQQMRGQVGDLYTGHTLISIPASASFPAQTLTRCQVTRVHFAPVSDPQIAAYVATGEPLNCAGCFALEGKGGLFVEKLEGCHSNVIGLSLPLLRQMVDELGHNIIDFWSSEV